MHQIEKIIYSVARWLNWLSGAALIAVMIIVCLNVIGRGFFERPLKGTVDITSLLGAVIIACAIANTQVLKGHIRIGLIVERLPTRLKYILESLVNLIGFVLFSLISWQTILFAKATFEIGELSEVIKIPLGPFASIVAIGCTALTLILLIDLIKSLSKMVLK
jgi:TRAP-type C4-dicarboxylate transport system permease small subunit